MMKYKTPDRCIDKKNYIFSFCKYVDQMSLNLIY